MSEDIHIFELEEGALFDLLCLIVHNVIGHNLRIHEYGFNCSYYFPTSYVAWIRIQVSYDRKEIELAVMKDITEEPKTEISRKLEE